MTRRREVDTSGVGNERRRPVGHDDDEVVALRELGNARSATLLHGGVTVNGPQLAAVQRLAGNRPARLLAVQRDLDTGAAGAGSLELGGLPTLPVLSASFGASMKATRNHVGAERDAELEATKTQISNLVVTRKPDAGSATIRDHFAKQAAQGASDGAKEFDGTLRLTQRGKGGNVPAGAFTLTGAQLVNYTVSEGVEKLEFAIDDFGQAEATKAAAAKASAELEVEGWDKPVPLLTSSPPSRKSEHVGGTESSFKVKHIGLDEIEPLVATVPLGPAVGKLKAAMGSTRLTMTYRGPGGRQVQMHDCLVTEVTVQAGGSGAAPVVTIRILPEHIRFAA